MMHNSIHYDDELNISPMKFNVNVQFIILLVAHRLRKLYIEIVVGGKKSSCEWKEWHVEPYTKVVMNLYWDNFDE